MKFSSIFYNPFKSSKPDLGRDTNQSQSRTSPTTHDNEQQKLSGDQNSSRNSHDSSSAGSQRRNAYGVIPEQYPQHLVEEFSVNHGDNSAHYPDELFRYSSSAQRHLAANQNLMGNTPSAISDPLVQTSPQQTSLQRRHSWPQEQDLESRDQSNSRPASVGAAVNDQTPVTTPSVSQSGSQQEVVPNSTPAATTPVEENYHDFRSLDRSKYHRKLAEKKKNYLAKLEAIENSSLSGKELLKELKNANWNRPSDCKEASQLLKNKIALVTHFEGQMKAIATDPISIRVKGFNSALTYRETAIDTIFGDKLTQCENLRSPIKESQVLTQTMKDRLLKRLDFHTNFIAQRYHHAREKKHDAIKYSIPNHYDAAYEIFRKEYKNGRNPYDKIIFKDLAPKEIREIVKTDSVGKGFNVWHMQKTWLGKNKPETVNQKLALQQRANSEPTENNKSIHEDEVIFEYPSSDDGSVVSSNILDTQERIEKASSGSFVNISEEFQKATLERKREIIQPYIQQLDAEKEIIIAGHDSLERHKSHRPISNAVPIDQDSDSRIYPTISMLVEPPTDAENGSISSNLTHDVPQEGTFTLPRPLQVETEEQSQTHEPTPTKVETIKRGIFSFPRITVTRSPLQESSKPYQPANLLPIPANLSDLFKLGRQKESSVKNKNTESARIAAAQNALSTLLATQLSIPDDALLNALAEKLGTEATEHEKNEIAKQAKAVLESGTLDNDRKSRENFVKEQLKNHYDLDGIYKNLKPGLIVKYGIEYDNKLKIVNSGDLADRIRAATKNHFEEKAKTTLTVFSSLQTQFSNDKNDFVRGFTTDSRIKSLLRESNKTKQDDFDYYTNEINQSFNVDTKEVNLTLIDHLAEIVRSQVAVNSDSPTITDSISAEDRNRSELLQTI